MAVSPTRRWAVLLPVKETPLAKTRLSGFTAADRARLAIAFALDAATAAGHCPWVRRVVAVSNDPAATARLRAVDVDVVPDVPDAGLNAALEYGAEELRTADPGTGVAAMSADLPALRPEALSAAFAAATAPRWFVPDAANRGTTLLAACGNVSLDPHFGRESRSAHLRTGAAPVDAPGLLSLRRDVDTLEDLHEAMRLGVGRHTATVLDGLTGAAAS